MELMEDLDPEEARNPQRSAIAGIRASPVHSRAMNRAGAIPFHLSTRLVSPSANRSSSSRSFKSLIFSTSVRLHMQRSGRSFYSRSSQELLKVIVPTLLFLAAGYQAPKRELRY
jgi:hypothetical protein